MTVRDFALAYARLGFPVLPLVEKDPFTPLARHGCYSATTDETLIASWFHPHSTLNLGIAGSESLAIVDVDPRSQGDDTLDRLQREHGDLPETPRVLTGRGDGGCHYYFAATGPLANGAFAVGLDLKSLGGYVVAPPSIHPDTKGRYRWDSRALLSRTPLAPLPEWIADLAQAHAPRDYGSATGKAAESFLGVAFAEASMLGSTIDDARAAVLCPWFVEHSDGRGRGRDSSTAILAPTEKMPLGAFSCAHSHCASRRTGDVLAALPDYAVLTAVTKYPELGELTARWLQEREAAE